MPELIEAHQDALVGGAGAQQIDVAVPAGTQPGRLLVAAVAWRGQVAITPADTWDAERHDEDAPAGPTLAVYTRVRQAGDPDVFTFSSGSTSRVVATVMRLHPWALWETSAAQAGASATPTAPGVTAGGPDRGLLGIWAWANAEDDTGQPEPLTEKVRVDSSGAAGGRVRLIVGAGTVQEGAVASKVLTLTPPNARSWVAALALVDLYTRIPYDPSWMIEASRKPV